MSDVITKNLVLLSQNIKNLKSILEQLEKSHIISKNESEYVLSGKSSLDRNSELLALIGRKDWEKVKTVFTEILKNTGNGQSVQLIESGGTATETAPLLGSKWWPMKKYLPSSFQPRNNGANLLIKDIRRSLQRDESHSVVLTGLPAIGKTATAISYARHYASKYDQIIWVSCLSGNYLSVTYSFYFLLCELDKSSYHIRDPPEWVRKVFLQLADLKCLFIYDSAKCPKGKNGIQDILPKNNANFHALITSRDVDWNFTTFKLDFLTPTESLEFMKNSLSPKVIYEDGELTEFCNLLDNWPLALQIANETLNGNEINLQSYMERVKYSDEIIRLHFWEYPLTFSDAVKILLEEISDERGEKSEIMILLFALGYLEADNISCQLLGDIMKLPSRPLEHHLKFLEKKSLLSRNVTVVNGEKVKTVSIPRMIQKGIRNYNEIPEEILTKILSASTTQLYKTLDLHKFALWSTDYLSFELGQIILADFVLLVKDGKIETALQLEKLIASKFPIYKTDVFNILLEKAAKIPKAEKGDLKGLLNLAKELKDITSLAEFVKKNQPLLNNCYLMRECIRRMNSEKREKWQKKVTEENIEQKAGFQKFYFIVELKKHSSMSNSSYHDLKNDQNMWPDLLEFYLLEKLHYKIPPDIRSEWEAKVAETKEGCTGLREFVFWINAKGKILK